MEQHVSSIRAEVLKQLIGVTGGWFFKIAVVILLFALVFFIYESLVDGSLSERIGLIKRAFFGSSKGFKKLTSSTRSIMYVLGALMLVCLGYSLGYQISTNYISGEITLITTVARITNFYSLTVVVIEMLLMLVSTIILLSTAGAIRKNTHEVYQTSTLAKFNLGLLKLLRVFGISVAVALGVASMVFCYLVIK